MIETFQSIFTVAEGDTTQIQRLKAKILKTFSLKSSVCLWNIADLSIHLLAVNRNSEALEIAIHTSNAMLFKGDFNIWSPVQVIAAIGSFISRDLGDHEATHAFLSVVQPSAYPPQVPLAVSIEFRHCCLALRTKRSA